MRYSDAATAIATIVIRCARRAKKIGTFIQSVHYLKEAFMLKMILAILVMLYASFSFAAVDANTGTAAELDSIKGIGPALSTRIIEERKKGNFKDWNDFVERIKGIGDGNAPKFSSAGLTVNGSSFKGAAPAAPSAARPATAAPTAAAPAAAAPPAAAPALTKEELKKAKAEEKAKLAAEAKAKKEAEKQAKKDAKKAEAAAPAASAAKK